jgi:AcrR family transcriptional regulator
MVRKNRGKVILDAVEQMVRDRRFHEVTLDEVAEAAHVGKGTIYRYFKDKDDLFFQLAVHGHEELCAAIKESAADDSGRPFEQRLVAVCERIDGFFRGRHALMRIMGEQTGRMQALHGKYRTEFEQRRAQLRAAVSKVLALGKATDELRNDVPLETLARLLLGLLRARAMEKPEDASSGACLALMVDLFLNGVRARAQDV